jgi:hypothetical protein
MTTQIFASGVRSLCVLLKSGAQIYLPVSEQPKITFDGTVMRVGNGDYQIENVRKWMVVNPEEIVLNIEDVQKAGTIVYKDGVLTVSKQADVRAYNAAGMEMPVHLKNGQVDMSVWPSDVYVVKVGKETLKIRKP